jgi:hypothetical protein
VARIRTVKPNFFRHEGLQDLAKRVGDAIVMLVYEGLWTQADSEGRFEWKPRQLKLDILPFLDFDMDAMLAALAGDGFIRAYEVSGKKYGEIPSFSEHQRITGKEKESGEKFPVNPEKQPGSTWEAPGYIPGAQEGERELGRGIGKGKDTRREDGGEFASANAKKPVWEMICEIWGFEPKTRTEFKRIEALFRDFTAKSGGNLQAIRDTVRRYGKVLPRGAVCTPEAVLKHWDMCQEPKKAPQSLPKTEVDRISQDEQEEAAWNALPQEERDRRWAEITADIRRLAGAA